MLLKINSQGEDVKKIQIRLGLVSDGIFGPHTQEAVKAWQTKNGLFPDGIIGDKTWNKMFAQIESISESVFDTSVFKLDKLKGYIPDSVISQIPETCKKFNITNVLRLSHFLAQCAHESGGFKVTTENLYYTSDGLKKIFPSYFPGNLSESYAKQPEKIASRVYGSRMGNGDESTKEGYKFSGKGYLQTTGKDNYKKLGDFLGVDLISNPDLVATKYPLDSAAFFFDSNKLWDICDKGNDVTSVTSVTKRVNGGVNGLAERIKLFNDYYKLLS